MKIGALLLSLFASTVVFARVGLEVSLNRDVYMQYERIYICLTIRNNSGRPLLFGKDPELQGFLMFDVRNERDLPMPKRGNEEISVTGLLLQPGEVRNMIFRLDNYYDFTRCGRYRVHAYISHNLLKHEFRSNDVSLSIERGVVEWSHTVGLPNLSDKKNAEQEERTYSIRKLKTGNELAYYLFVESEKQIFCVARIGRAFGIEKVQAEVDNFSRLHLLIPLSSRVFNYQAFGVNGERLENTYWRISDSIPGLFRDAKTGRVRRVGGAKARPGLDFQLSIAPGHKTGSQILNENEKSKRSKPIPRPYSGVVDMGKDVMADAPGSRDK